VRHCFKCRRISYRERLVEVKAEDYFDGDVCCVLQYVVSNSLTGWVGKVELALKRRSSLGPVTSALSSEQASITANRAALMSTAFSGIGRAQRASGPRDGVGWQINVR
jgi:hypothetical protein